MPDKPEMIAVALGHEMRLNQILKAAEKGMRLDDFGFHLAGTSGSGGW